MKTRTEIITKSYKLCVMPWKHFSEHCFVIFCLVNCKMFLENAALFTPSLLRVDAHFLRTGYTHVVTPNDEKLKTMWHILKFCRYTKPFPKAHNIPWAYGLLAVIHTNNTRQFNRVSICSTIRADTYLSRSIIGSMCRYISVISICVNTFCQNLMLPYWWSLFREGHHTT
jgi:hypothetical protein